MSPHPRRVPLSRTTLVGSIVLAIVVVFVVLVLGVPVPAVIAVVAVPAAVVLYVLARRALRRASTRIDTILREELDEGRRDVSFLEEDLPQRTHRQH